MITEGDITEQERTVNRLFKRIIENMDTKQQEVKALPRVDVYDKNLMINEEMTSVINKLDDLLNDSLEEILTEDISKLEKIENEESEG